MLPKNDLIDAGNFDTGQGIDEKIIRLRAVKQENRQDLLHKTTHIVGILIIISFLMFSFISIFFMKNFELPGYFVGIVATVIGFYFGNSLK